MAELKSANSARPSSLGSPVPQADAQANADSFLASFDAPKTSLAGGDVASVPQAQAAAPATADSFLASFDAPAESPAAPAPEFAPEPTALQANMQQFNPKNFIDRLQTGLAANDTEKANFLRQKYGAGNVTIKNDAIYYRRDPKDKMKRLDPAALEVISDILPDFAREIVTEATMLPGELVGGAAGFFAGAPTAVGALPGAALGAQAGRVASVPLANAAADKAAELAGVPQDPSRSITQENLVGMGAEAVLPVVGRYAAKAAKFVPGTAAYKTAKAAGEREVVALSKQSQEVIAAANELEKSGILKKLNGAELGVPGANVSLMLHQVQPDSPTIQRLVKEAAEMPKFLNAQTKQAEAYGSAVENTLLEIAKRDGHGPVAPEKLASTVTDAVASIDRSEGKAIGRFRSEAMKNLKNAKQPLPEPIQKDIQGLMTQFGFKFRANPATGKVVPVPPSDLRPILGTKGLTKVGEVRSVVNALNEIGRTQLEGGPRLSDLDRLVAVVGDLNPKLRGSAAGGEWGRLTGNLRQHRRAVIESGLADDFSRKAFNDSMDDFALLRQNTEQLQNVLRGDVSAKTIVSGIFKGKENLANVRALKSIVGANSPEYGALKEEFVNQLLMKHSADSATGFNSTNFLKDIEQNYGDSFMKEVLNDGRSGPNYDTVKQLLTVGKRIESTFRGVKPEMASEKAKQDAMNAAIGILANIKFKAVNGIAGLFGAAKPKDSALFQIMSRDGIEKYVANYPGKIDKKAVTQNLQDLLAQYKFYRKAAAEVVSNKTPESVKSLVKAAPEGVRRATRPAIKGTVKSLLGTPAKDTKE